MEWWGEGGGEWADGLGGKLVGEGTKLDLLRRLYLST